MGNCCATTGELKGQDLDTKPNNASNEQKQGGMDQNDAAMLIQANFRGKITRQAVEH